MLSHAYSNIEYIMLCLIKIFGFDFWNKMGEEKEITEVQVGQ